MIPVGILSQGSDAMVIEVRVTSGSLSASIYPDGSVNIDVDWGDGNSDTYTTSGAKTHNYASAGTYYIRITGSLQYWGSSTGVDKTKIYSISSWGDLGITSLADGCRNMSNISYVAPIPNTVISTSFMFYAATSFNGDISGWNVSSITNMDGMFGLALLFNQNISNWDVSNVVSMESMFYNALAFNQDLSSWCVENIPTYPTDFDTDATAWVLPRPIWGTCP